MLAGQTNGGCASQVQTNGAARSSTWRKYSGKRFVVDIVDTLSRVAFRLRTTRSDGDGASSYMRVNECVLPRRY